MANVMELMTSWWCTATDTGNFANCCRKLSMVVKVSASLCPKSLHLQPFPRAVDMLATAQLLPMAAAAPDPALQVTQRADNRDQCICSGPSCIRQDDTTDLGTVRIPCVKKLFAVWARSGQLQCFAHA